MHITDMSGEGKTFETSIEVHYTDHGIERSFEAVGNGPIDAVRRGLHQNLGLDVKILDYEEHALQSGSNSQAAAYIHLLDSNSGHVTYVDHFTARMWQNDPFAGYYPLFQ